MYSCICLVVLTAHVRILLVCVFICLCISVLSHNTASQFLSRHKRANSLFEESKKGNLERECIEELCNKEEAREIFENHPETEYFYPKYVACLGSHRVGINNQNSDAIPSDLRTCVREISDQCTPPPCYKEGTKSCVDGQASFTCECKPGWKGPRCEDDIDECSDPEFPAGCNQKCYNLPGSFHCMCEDGYFINDKVNCVDIDECLMYPSLCKEPAKCVNTPGMYECRCPLGFKYDFASKSCNDIDECELSVCDGTCINTVGSYACHCDGRQGLHLAKNERYCERIPVCVELTDDRHSEMLYLGEQFAGLPVIYLRFRLPENTKFAAEFDFRTFDPEGVVLYAESSQDSWFMLGLRGGQIEIQFRNQHTSKVTSGGKAINDGQWHVISVDELESSISVKISKEAVMSINSPDSLFTSVNGKLETKVYIAGLPNRTDNIIKPINPRLDGCIRGWNLMNQGASGVREVIREKRSKQCFVHVERGSFFTGKGLAKFDIDYIWHLHSIHPKYFGALSSHSTVSFALLLEISTHVSLCMSAHIYMYKHRHTWLKCSDALWEALKHLNSTMQNPISTYIGGIPDAVPLPTTPVTAFYHGCMDITINGQQLDFDMALSKHNSIKSHSCPPLSAPERYPDAPYPHRK
uniref:Vitamin K-dependent protein S n=1 Tax=Sander lucioperca TaxID=283035 RepID=A0A8C9YCU4_SANLU